MSKHTKKIAKREDLSDVLIEKHTKGSLWRKEKCQKLQDKHFIGNASLNN